MLKIITIALYFVALLIVIGVVGLTMQVLNASVWVNAIVSGILGGFSGVGTYMFLRYVG